MFGNDGEVTEGEETCQVENLSHRHRRIKDYSGRMFPETFIASLEIRDEAYRRGTYVHLIDWRNKWGNKRLIDRTLEASGDGLVPNFSTGATGGNATT